MRCRGRVGLVNRDDIIEMIGLSGLRVLKEVLLGN